MDRKQTRLTLIAAILAAAFGPAAAQETVVDRLTRPENSISLGLGSASRDLQRFGIFNGLNDRGAYGLVDVSLNRLDTATGTWLRMSGSNLGLDNRELRFETSRQGDWGVFVEYGRTPRVSPYTVNTGLQGIGSDSQTVSAAAPKRDVELKTVREQWRLGLDKQLAGNFDVQVRFKTEDKDGSRLFGRGTTTGSVFEFLAEPIHSTTRQLDASLAYTGDRLQLVGGYYGTSFVNHNPSLTVADAANAAVNCVGAAAPAPAATIGCFSPMSLPPGNQSHQIYLTGGYNFTPATRSNFKLAFTRAKQDEAFMAATALQPNNSGRNDLGGRVDTTLAQLGLSARPLPKLSINASLRYEDRDDRTPVVRYVSNGLGATSTLTGENEPRSLTTTSGKLEAGYQLPMGFRLNGGLEYEKKKRNTSDVRSVSFRETTEETTARLELRRVLAETLTGAVSYAYSDRSGSDFLTNVLRGATGLPPYGAVGSNVIAPLHLADRQRDRLRLAVDWAPTDALSFQFAIDHSEDDYGRRTLGVDSGNNRVYSVDASYSLSEAWKLTGWLALDDGRIRQSSCRGSGQNPPAAGGCRFTGAAQDTVWAADLRTAGSAVGFGVRGKATEKLALGGEIQAAYDRQEYDMSKVKAGIGVDDLVVTSLPDTYSKRFTFSAFAEYALQKNAGLRASLVHERWHSDDWTWANYVYTDGTTVLPNARQNATFVGISAYYKWW